jgi:hypothetical protein
MLLKRFTDFILKSRIQAIGMAFVFAFFPLVGSISILMSAFVTLRDNARDGFILLIAATLPLFLALYGAPAETAADSITNTDIVCMMAICNVFTWFFAVILRKYASWNWLIQLAAVICIVLVIAAHLIMPDIQGFWQGRLTNYFNNTVNLFNNASGNDPGQKATIGRMVETLTSYATGLTLIFVTFYALLQVMLARWWQAALYNRGGLRSELSNIRLSYAAGIVLIITQLLVLAGNKTALDVIPVLYLAFVIAGFSVLTVVIANTKKPWLWNGLLGVAAFLVPASMLLVALVALLDVGLDLRKRFQKKTININ